MNPDRSPPIAVAFNTTADASPASALNPSVLLLVPQQPPLPPNVGWLSDPSRRDSRTRSGGTGTNSPDVLAGSASLVNHPKRSTIRSARRSVYRSISPSADSGTMLNPAMSSLARVVFSTDEAPGTNSPAAAAWTNPAPVVRVVVMLTSAAVAPGGRPESDRVRSTVVIELFAGCTPGWLICSSGRVSSSRWGAIVVRRPAATAPAASTKYPLTSTMM